LVCNHREREYLHAPGRGRAAFGLYHRHCYRGGVGDGAERVFHVVFEGRDARLVTGEGHGPVRVDDHGPVEGLGNDDGGHVQRTVRRGVVGEDVYYRGEAQARVGCVVDSHGRPGDCYRHRGGVGDLPERVLHVVRERRDAGYAPGEGHPPACVGDRDPVDGLGDYDDGSRVKRAARR